MVAVVVVLTTLVLLVVRVVELVLDAQVLVLETLLQPALRRETMVALQLAEQVAVQVVEVVLEQ
jgi:hypothetical protein